MDNKKKKLLNFYADPKLINDLRKVASSAKIPQSVILREAVTEKVAEYTARIKQGEKFELGVVTK